jgi:hypothetical protein
VITTGTEVLAYTFESGDDGWICPGQIPPYDPPISAATNSVIGLGPDGSTNCFSYWFSPDAAISDGTLYSATFDVTSTAATMDETLQIRLRVNQKGSWQAWDRTVNSNYDQSPMIGVTKTYRVLFDPQVTGAGDDFAVFSFDLLSFDWSDNVNSWLMLDEMRLEEAAVSP